MSVLFMLEWISQNGCYLEVIYMYCITYFFVNVLKHFIVKISFSVVYCWTETSKFGNHSQSCRELDENS